MVDEHDLVPAPTPPDAIGRPPLQQSSAPQPTTGGAPASDGQASDTALAEWPIPQDHRLAVPADFDGYLLK
eukprot:1078809-Lingulodinium_polyedra.AAC.1